MARDLHNLIKASRGFSPAAAVTDDTAYVSQILDTQDFEAAELLIVCGAIPDANVTFVLLVEEGDVSNLSDAAAVADADLIGTEANGAPLLGSDDKVCKIGYKGKKRYVRATLTPTGNTGSQYIAMAWLQAFPKTGIQTAQRV